MQIKSQANIKFIQNLNTLVNSGQLVPTQMTYSDGTQAKAITIGTIQEVYTVDNFYDCYGCYNIPIQTYRNTPILSGIKEIHWIYELQSNKLKDLESLGIKQWWDKFTLRKANLLDLDKQELYKDTIGQAYGATVAKYKLLSNFYEAVLNKPYARDLLLTLWQEEDIQFQRTFGGLLPCVYSFKINLFEAEKENLVTFTLNQRSSDYLTANSINKSQYFGLFLDIINSINKEIEINKDIAEHFNSKLLRFHKFIHNVDDLHIYDRHLKVAKTLINQADTVYHEPVLIRHRNNEDFLYKSFDIIKPKALDYSKLEFATF